MNTRDLILKAYNQGVFIKVEPGGAEDLESLQEIFRIAKLAEASGLLEEVFSHTDDASGLIDIVYLSGSTTVGRSKVNDGNF